MIHYKQFKNGLRLIINKMEGMYSVSCGVAVKTGSVNETEEINGISHFIEHMLFKGTTTRTAFEISDSIDRIGAQINAFTSKELTCYYTKSTKEHVGETLEILSDIFFNSTFDKVEMEREKGVVIEEINMSEDSPEDVCLDLLAKSYFGTNGYGRTILGTAKNVRSFNKDKIKDYMNKYYTADNVVISIAGNVDVSLTERLVEEYFANNFKVYKSSKQKDVKPTRPTHLYRTKKIEQAHIGFAMKGLSINDEMGDAFSIANIVLGGGMSSRLFQKIREELGLAYSVYSYASCYKNQGVLEICAGVTSEQRDNACNAIIEEVRRIKKDGITENEFMRGKEQVKSAMIMSRESTGSQMLLHAKHLILLDKTFDFNKNLKKLEKITLKDVLDAIDLSFDIDNASTATVGRKKTPLVI